MPITFRKPRSFAQTGNTEIGFLAMSLTLTPEMKGSVYVIDPKWYKPVEQDDGAGKKVGRRIRKPQNS